MVNGVLKKAGVEQDYIEVNDNVPNRQIIGTVARSAASFIGVKNANDFEIYKDWLLAEGILTEDLAGYFTDSEATANAAEVIVLCANLYDWFMAHGADGVSIE